MKRPSWLKEAAEKIRDMIQCLEDGETFSAYSYRRMTTLYYITSYIYYARFISIISDDLFDKLCTQLESRHAEQDEWVYHKVDKASLTAGTGYALQYPTTIQNLGETLIPMMEKRV